ncbi:class F sortase [Actinomadura macrotermitis]|uniref:class F sortase n=1 Tax=Actinomadura macrotermitis TaxID=2585200 RepID=UPI002E26D792
MPSSARAAARLDEPVRLSIPSLDVQTELERLATGADGVLGTPRDPAKAGWYAAGVRPGDQGPAVIAGHVDSRTGPAVFARLRELRRGAEVLVADARGRTARFTVDEVRVHAKAAFPTAEVYGPTPDAQLRLITCGGAFDRARGHYRDNVIVYATRT